MKKTLFLFAAIFLIYCNAEPESESKPEPESETFTIEIIDGVRHVHNLAPKWGDKPKVELEFVRKIGDMESDNENYMLFRPPDISMDSEGNIFILDAG
ncbi:MAG: hypothetical protein GY863_01160, partial [bacterium]|nr:hypothetical protein [bacterium]